MASSNYDSNVVTCIDDHDGNPEGTIKTNDGNHETVNKNDANAYDEAENDPNMTYSFVETNNDGNTKDLNRTHTVIEKSSSSELVKNDNLTYDINDDKSVDIKVTNDNSTDSDSFAIIDNDDAFFTPSTSSSSIDKKVIQQNKGTSLSFDSKNSLDENLVKLICQTVETTLKTYLSKYNFKKNKRKTRNRHSKKKMTDSKKTKIKNSNKNDTNVPTNHNHIFCTKKPEHFNLETDIFGIKNDMMDVAQNNITNKNDNASNFNISNENASNRLSPQHISDIVDSTLNYDHKTTLINKKQGLNFNDGCGLSYKNDKGNSEKLSNHNLDKNSFTHITSGNNQTAVIGKVLLTSNQPPWWFRDNILLATELLNKGTSSAKFHHCYLEDENMKTRLYETMRTQSLTYMTQYENKSFEELRYEDYILQEMGAYIRHRINPGDFRLATDTRLIVNSRDTPMYAPTFAQEEFIKKNGDIERNQVKYHCISCMKDCKNISLEELRLDYYTKNNTNQGIIRARAHEATANHNLDRALGETALKNYQLLDKKLPNPAYYSECVPTTSKESETQESIFKNSLFNDSETISKSIFTKSNNPFFNPFTHCRLPEFKLPNSTFENIPKNSTEKSVYDVPPAKLNFVFNPNPAPLKKTGTKSNSKKSKIILTKILSKSNDSSKLLFGWSCKPFNFSKPAEPCLSFSKTSEEPKFANTSNIFGVKPKNKGSVFSNDIFQATINKLLNENNNQTVDCVMNENKNVNIDLSSNASTSAMDPQVIERQTDSVFKETSQLLHNIEDLTTKVKSESEKMTQIDAKNIFSSIATKADTKADSSYFSFSNAPKENKKNDDNDQSKQNPLTFFKTAPVSNQLNTSKPTTSKFDFSFPKTSLVSNQLNTSKPTTSKFDFSFPKTSLVSNQLNTSKPTTSKFDFSFPKTSPVSNQLNTSKPTTSKFDFSFPKTSPVSNQLNTSKPTTSKFNFSFHNDDKHLNDTKLNNPNTSTSIFGESKLTENANKNCSFFFKPSYQSKDINNIAMETSGTASNATNSCTTIFGERKENEFQFKQRPKSDDIMSKLGQSILEYNQTKFDSQLFGRNESEFKNSNPIDIKQSKPFWLINHSPVDSNSQNKQLSKDNQSNASTSIFNQQKRPEFEFNNPIGGEQSLASWALSSNHGANNNKIDTKSSHNPQNTNQKQSIFGTPNPSFFKSRPNENILHQSPETDFDILPESTNFNTTKNTSLPTNTISTSSNNGAIPKLNSTANNSRLWTSYFSLTPSKSKSSDDGNIHITNLDPSLLITPEFNFADSLRNTEQSCTETGLPTTSSIDSTTSNIQTYGRAVLMNKLTETPHCLQDANPSRPFEFKFSNLDPRIGQSSRIFNCINESKINQVLTNSTDFRERSASDNVIPNLTDDSSDDDVDTDSEFVKTELENLGNEMIGTESLNSRSDVLNFARFDGSNALNVLINKDSNSNTDNVKPLKPLQVRRFNCTERNRVENGIDDDHAKYIFGKTTVKCGFKIELHLKNFEKTPKFYVGLTTCNPENLTDFEMPYQPGDLCERTESWTLKDVSQAVMGVNKITLSFQNQGVANIICDNTTIQQLLIDYSVCTWPFFVIQSGHVEIDFLTDDIQDGGARSAVEVNKSDCVICYENPVDTVLYRCGHSCLCLKCGKLMLKNLGICPICRDMIHDVIKIYTS